MSNWRNKIKVSTGNAIGAGGGADGNVIVALFNVGDSTRRKLYASISRDGGLTWSPAVDISGDVSTLGVTPPQAAVGPDGWIYVIFQAYEWSGNPSFHRVYFTSCSPVGVWTAAKALTNVNSNGASIAIGPTGTLYVSMVDIFSSTDTNVSVISSQDRGITFPTSQDISGRGGYCNETAVAVSSINERAVAYEYAGQLFATVTNGGVWQPPVLLGSSAGGKRWYWPRLCPGFFLTAQSNGTDGVHSVLWRWTVDGGWSNPTTIAANAYNPAPGVAGNDVIVCYTSALSGMNAEAMAKYTTAIPDPSNPTAIPATVSLTLEARSSADDFATKVALSGPSPERATGVQVASGVFGLVAIAQDDPHDGNWEVDAWVYPVAAQHQQQFDDVPASRWSHDAITRVVAAGYMTGETPTHFGVTDPLDREQLAVVLDRIFLHH